MACYNADMPRREKEPITPLGRALRTVRKRARMPQDDFAVVVGVSASHYPRYERGTLRPPENTFDEMLAAMRKKGIEGVDELIAVYSAEGVSETSAPYPARPSDAEVPLVGEASAEAALNPEEIRGEWFPALQEHAERADAGVARVRGYSMVPELQPGDYIGISASKEPTKGNIVLARRGDELLLKRFAGRRGRRIRLESDNPAYPPVEGGDIQVLGVMVWSHRDYG